MLIDWAESADADLADILSYFMAENEEKIGKDIVSKIIKSVGGY